MVWHAALWLGDLDRPRKAAARAQREAVRRLGTWRQVPGGAPHLEA